MHSGLSDDLTRQIALVLLISTLPGGLGGLATFLYGIKRGHFKNNKYLAKLTIEVVGGMLVASFVAFEPRPLVGFAVGLSWSGLIQIIRAKITAYVEGALGQSFKDRDGT